MSELKTLKDIGAYNYSGEAMVIRNELRAEAIIWIKKLDNTDEHFVALLSGLKEHDMKVMSDTFKHFFNITEEDLI